MQTRNLLIAFQFLSTGITAQQIPEKDVAFSSSIISIKLKTPITPPTTQQAKDNILWYKGRKIDDSTLITPQATIVRWSKARDIVIVQPKKDPFIKMSSELLTTEKRKKQLYEKMAERKTSIMFYPAIVASFNELDNIAKKYADAIKNTINLPPALQTTTFLLPKWKKGGTASLKFNAAAGIPEYIKRAYQGVMASMKNYPSIDFPAPPATDFGYCLNYCDSNAKTANEQIEMAWQKEFLSYEAGIVTKSLAIVKQIEILNLRNDPEAEPLIAGLEKAKEFAIARSKNKVDILIRKYGKDFTRITAVVRAAISFERQTQLLGTGVEETNSSIIPTVVSLLDGFDSYMEQQKNAKNYNVAFNLPLIIGMERQRQLLGADDSDNRLNEQIDRYWAFNRFKIDVALDFNSIEENDCGTSTDKVSAKNELPHFVSAAPLNCKFILLQHEQHLNEAPLHLFGIAADIILKTGAGKRVDMHTDPDDSEKCITETFPYSNLPLKLVMPHVRMSFCENTSGDTVFISDLATKGVNEKRGPSKIYEFYPSNEHDEEEDDNQYEAEENNIKKIIEEYVFNQSKSSRKLSLEETQKYQQAIARMEAIKKEKDKGPFFTFKAKNGEPTIIDAGTTVIAEDKIHKDMYDKEKKSTTDYRIKVVHDPLPYKKQ